MFRKSSSKAFEAKEGAWGGWKTRGSGYKYRPECLSEGGPPVSRNLRCYVIRESDNSLATIQKTGSQFGSPIRIGGQWSGPVSCVPVGRGLETYCYGRGLNRNVYAARALSRTGQVASGIQGTGAGFIDDPLCMRAPLRTSNDTVLCFGRNQSRSLSRLRFTFGAVNDSYLQMDSEISYGGIYESPFSCAGYPISTISCFGQGQAPTFSMYGYRISNPAIDTINPNDQIINFGGRILGAPSCADNGAGATASAKPICVAFGQNKTLWSHRQMNFTPSGSNQQWDPVMASTSPVTFPTMLSLFAKPSLHCEPIYQLSSTGSRIIHCVTPNGLGGMHMTFFGT